jgi:hypothetical protein
MSSKITSSPTWGRIEIRQTEISRALQAHAGAGITCVRHTGLSHLTKINVGVRSDHAPSHVCTCRALLLDIFISESIVQFVSLECTITTWCAATLDTPFLTCDLCPSLCSVAIVPSFSFDGCPSFSFDGRPREGRLWGETQGPVDARKLVKRCSQT